jgi:hypothetical protein
MISISPNNNNNLDNLGCRNYNLGSKDERRLIENFRQDLNTKDNTSVILRAVSNLFVALATSTENVSQKNLIKN